MTSFRHPLPSPDILNGTLTGADVFPDSLDGNDLAQLDGDDIIDETITSFDIADNNVGSAEVLDFSLTNEDVGVLFAQVSAAGVLDNHSGGVSILKLLPAGQYVVDFGRNITTCAFTATLGASGVASSTLGEVCVADRFGDVEAVFVDTYTFNSSAFDRPLHLIVVC